MDFNFETDYEKFILNLVKENKISPVLLFSKTEQILEDYIESITSSEPVPVLYNGSYGGFSYSTKFVKFVTNTSHIDEKEKKNSEDDEESEDEDEKLETIAYRMQEHRTKFYHDILSFGRHIIMKDPKIGHDEYVKVKYNFPLIQRHLDQVAHSTVKTAQIKTTLEKLTKFKEKGIFGTDPIDVYFCEEIKDDQIETKTSEVIDKMIKYLHGRLEYLSFNASVSREQWMKDNDNDENLFEKLCELAQNEKEWDNTGFDLSQMVWFDPLTKTIQPINETLLEKVVQNIGTKEASGKYCKLCVEWVPKNKSYTVGEYDGFESINVGTRLAKLKKLERMLM